MCLDLLIVRNFPRDPLLGSLFESHNFPCFCYKINMKRRSLVFSIFIELFGQPGLFRIPVSLVLGSCALACGYPLKPHKYDSSFSSNCVFKKTKNFILSKPLVFT